MLHMSQTGKGFRVCQTKQEFTKWWSQERFDLQKTFLFNKNAFKNTIHSNQTEANKYADKAYYLADIMIKNLTGFEEFIEDIELLGDVYNLLLEIQLLDSRKQTLEDFLDQLRTVDIVLKYYDISNNDFSLAKLSANIYASYDKLRILNRLIIKTSENKIYNQQAIKTEEALKKILEEHADYIQYEVVGDYYLLSVERLFLDVKSKAENSEDIINAIFNNLHSALTYYKKATEWYQENPSEQLNEDCSFKESKITTFSRGLSIYSFLILQFINESNLDKANYTIEQAKNYIDNVKKEFSIELLDADQNMNELQNTFKLYTALIFADEDDYREVLSPLTFADVEVDQEVENEINILDKGTSPDRFNDFNQELLTISADAGSKINELLNQHPNNPNLISLKEKMFQEINVLLSARLNEMQTIVNPIVDNNMDIDTEELQISPQFNVDTYLSEDGIPEWNNHPIEQIPINFPLIRRGIFSQKKDPSSSVLDQVAKEYIHPQFKTKPVVSKKF